MEGKATNHSATPPEKITIQHVSFTLNFLANKNLKDKTTCPPLQLACRRQPIIDKKVYIFNLFQRPVKKSHK